MSRAFYYKSDEDSIVSKTDFIQFSDIRVVGQRSSLQFRHILITDGHQYTRQTLSDRVDTAALSFNNDTLLLHTVTCGGRKCGESFVANSHLKFNHKIIVKIHQQC